MWIFKIKNKAEKLVEKYNLQDVLEKIFDECGRFLPLCKKVPVSLQFIAYTIIGAIAVTSDFIMFAILYAIFKQPYVNVASYLFGTLVSFLLNSMFNFKVFSKWHVRYPKLVIIALIGSLWSSWVIAFLISHGVWALIAKLLVLPLVLVYQYVLAKKFVYHV